MGPKETRRDETGKVGTRSGKARQLLVPSSEWRYRRAVADLVCVLKRGERVGLYGLCGSRVTEVHLEMQERKDVGNTEGGRSVSLSLLRETRSWEEDRKTCTDLEQSTTCKTSQAEVEERTQRTETEEAKKARMQAMAR